MRGQPARPRGQKPPDSHRQPRPQSLRTAPATRTAAHKLTRNEMNELIEHAGGRSSSSASKKTALVIAGDGAGSKRAKAESLGIRLATPDDLAALVDGYLN